MQDSTYLLVSRLREYCRTKPGAGETLITFGETRPTYRLLGGFSLGFADFYLDEEPVKLLLRCGRELQQQIKSKYPAHIRLSTRISGTGNWKWIEVDLDGLVPEDELLHLIDRSYGLVFERLNEHDKHLIALGERNPTVQEAIDSLIKLHQLWHHRQEILDLIQRAILLYTRSSEQNSLALGQTKIGGLPDLPEQWGWPTFDEKPLAFLAQINLAEIPAQLRLKPLPEKGILYFFSVFGWQQEDGDLHPDLAWERGVEPGFSQVLYLIDADNASLKRCTKPEGIKTFKAASVEFMTRLTLPRAAVYARDPIVETLGWSEEEYERLDKLYFDFDFAGPIPEAIGAQADSFLIDHQLLGYPASIQHSPTKQGERLLFQVSSDYYNAEMMWGDGGMIYFVIDSEALEHLDFSEVKSDYAAG